MVRDAQASPLILEYAGPGRAQQSPRRWWVLAVFALAILGLQFLQPRMTPPGWPSDADRLTFVLIGLGGVLMGAATSLPSPVVGLFGAVSILVMAPGQLADRRLHFHLNAAGAVGSIVSAWCVGVIVAWVVCRGCVLLRALFASAEDAVGISG